MKLTQGTFSFLPPLDDDEIASQLRYAIAKGWAIGIETSSHPHPRSVYWAMWRAPMFDLTDPAEALGEIQRAREAFPDRYVRVTAYDASLGRQTTALAFIAGRPAVEPPLRLDRAESAGRRLTYTLRP